MNNRLLPPNATLDQRVEFALADAEQYANTGFEKLLVQLVKDLKAAQQMPEGWKLVPDVPTASMINAGLCGCMDNDVTCCVYRKMLAAAPAAPRPVVGEDVPDDWADG